MQASFVGVQGAACASAPRTRVGGVSLPPQSRKMRLGRIRQSPSDFMSNMNKLMCLECPALPFDQAWAPTAELTQVRWSSERSSPDIA